jgi:hypothetical protein
MLGLGKHKGELLEQVHAVHCGTVVVMAWDVRDAEWAKVRILRSVMGPAEGPDDAELPAMQQTAVCDGVAAELRDDDINPTAESYFYTIFVEGPDGAWHDQIHFELAPQAEIHWSRDEKAAPGPSAARVAALQHEVTAD